jgi:tubulin--tyrosine ligase
MVDESFDPWLIEINTNPDLTTGCALLQRLIPELLEHSLRIAVDPIFPPPDPSPK